MTREEAIKLLKETIERLSAPNGYLWPDERKVLLDVFSVLRGPAPDPDTGLLPCGCGGKARIKHDGSYSSKCIVENAGGTVRYETSTVEYPGHTHAWVDCDNEKCKCSVGYCGGLIFKTDEEARDAWNVAMGYNSLKTNPCDNCIGPMLAITHGYKNMKIRKPEVEG